ncbi:MAG: hypothetical protein Q7R99_02675 [bacterium]|nr:hypothetical protein [bacterium]
MLANLSGIFYKNVSSIASLIFIGFLAFILGTYVIIEARKIEKLQEPLPFYVGHFSTSTLPLDY